MKCINSICVLAARLLHTSRMCMHNATTMQPRAASTEVYCCCYCCWGSCHVSTILFCISMLEQKHCMTGVELQPAHQLGLLPALFAPSWVLQSCAAALYLLLSYFAQNGNRRGPSICSAKRMSVRDTMMYYTASSSKGGSHCFMRRLL